MMEQVHLEQLIHGEQIGVIMAIFGYLIKQCKVTKHLLAMLFIVMIKLAIHLPL